MNKKLKIFLNEFEDYLGTFCFITITILLAWQAISRYVFNYSFTWTEEVSMILFIWLAYLGGSAGILKGKHLRVDFFLDLVNYKTRRVLLLISNIISGIFCAYIFFPLMRVFNNYTISKSKTALLGIPKNLTFIMVPLCMLLTFIRLIQDSSRVIKTMGEGEDSISPEDNKIIFDDTDGVQSYGEERVND